METNTKISAGEVIVLTSGEYSDYGIAGYIVARVDFDIGEAIVEFKEIVSKEPAKYLWSTMNLDFIAWLVSTERAVPVEHREIHVGSYGELEIGGDE